FTGWYPKYLHSWPLANQFTVDIDRPLASIGKSYIITLLWQHVYREFPPQMLLNLYFNGDNLNPGISVVVPYRFSLTQFRVNTSPTTLSLYGRDVENTGGLFYDDGQLRAHLGAAFYTPSTGPTLSWRPGDLENLDRVGMRALKPDGFPDGVLVYELVIEPSQRPAQPAQN